MHVLKKNRKKKKSKNLWPKELWFFHENDLIKKKLLWENFEKLKDLCKIDTI